VGLHLLAFGAFFLINLASIHDLYDGWSGKLRSHGRFF
jgi:hypothetical protein